MEHIKTYHSIDLQRSLSEPLLTEDEHLLYWNFTNTVPHRREEDLDHENRQCLLIYENPETSESNILSNDTKIN